MTRQAASELDTLLDHWRDGPLGPPPRVRPRLRGGLPVFMVRRWEEGDGDPGMPRSVAGRKVIEHLRTRHDVEGCLVVLEDGRYAVAGPLLVIGSAAQVQEHARKRLRRAADDAEVAWWQEVIGRSAA